MKAWEIIKLVCQLPTIEIESMALSIRLGGHLGVVQWTERPAIDTRQSFRPRSFVVDFSDTSLNSYGQNKLIVDLFEVLKNEPDTEPKEEKLNKSS